MFEQPPDKISLDKLKLLKKNAGKGITQLELAEFKAKARSALVILQGLAKDLDECQTLEVNLERWQDFEKGRRSIKAAIRNIQRSIQT